LHRRACEQQAEDPGKTESDGFLGYLSHVFSIHFTCVKGKAANARTLGHSAGRKTQLSEIQEICGRGYLNRESRVS
jgi:hypothetical protein